MSAFDVFDIPPQSHTSTGSADNRKPLSDHRQPILAAYEAALAVASEVRIETLLERIVEWSRTVARAQIAALQQSGVSGEASPHFYATSAAYADGAEDISTLLDALYGSMPQITSPVTVPRLSMLADFSLKGSAFGDLPVLIVPILSGKTPIGSLVLLGREDEESFDGNDLDAIKLLSEHAAAAIDRAQMYDISEMRTATAREQVSQLRQVLDNMPAGVLVMQPPDGGIQMTNDAALEMIFGPGNVSVDTPVALRDFGWQGTDGRDTPRQDHPGVRALRGDRTENRQLTLVNAVGDQIPVLVQAAPVYGDDGEIISAVVVFQDFSSIRAAEQIKDDFLSLISHEFRTPLTAIHGGALLLSQQGEYLDDETRRELLDDIGMESARLDRMLGNLLSVAEIMAGRFQRDTEPIVLEPLIKELIEEFRERTGIHELVWEDQARLPLAEGDPDWLSQIMRNLYENAIKYSPEGGEIVTVARRVGEHVRISVTDSGLGIFPDHVPQVFERFRRPGADPTVRGMGLGLYLSRLLVDAMGGSIFADSDGPGKGSTFTVQLPIVREWELETEGGASDA